MARSVANLAVSVTAKTSKFRKGMGRARKSLKRFSGAVNKTIKRLGAFGVALGTLAVGGGLAIMLKRSMANIDAMAKLADRIGTTTEKLAGLQHAAELTGAGTELLNKSLDVMSKRLGEAVGGTGEAKDVIEDLKLNLQKLIEMDPADAFRKIADKISKLGTQAEKAAAASKIFSRAGLQLVNMLDLGSKGLAEMHAEAVRLGLAFSRIDAAKVEAANDAITRMQAAFRGLAQTLAIQLAPTIEALANQITAIATSGGSAADKAVRAFRAMTLGAAKFADMTELIKVGWESLRFVVGATVTSILTVMEKAARGITQLFDAIPGVTGDFTVADDLKRLAEGFAHTTEEALADAETAWTRFTTGAAAKGVNKFFDDIEKRATAAGEKIAGAAPGKKKGLLGAFLDDLKSLGGDARKSITAFGETFGKLAVKGAKKNFFDAFGSLLSSFFGAAGKSAVGGAALSAATFREVDLGRVAIGGARGLKKTQKVEDKAVVAAVKQNTMAVKNINLGLA